MLTLREPAGPGAGPSHASLRRCALSPPSERRLSAPVSSLLTRSIPAARPRRGLSLEVKGLQHGNEGTRHAPELTCAAYFPASWSAPPSRPRAQRSQGIGPPKGPDLARVGANLSRFAWSRATPGGHLPPALCKATGMNLRRPSLAIRDTELPNCSRGDLDGELAVLGIVTAEHSRDVDGKEALDDRSASFRAPQ
jgi:hypothetical protein